MVARCEELGGFEVAPARPELSVVCLRHLPGGIDGPELDAYQDRLQRALEVDGTGWLSTTRLRGKTYLRAGIVNYLARPDDVDRVLDALIRLSPSVR
jgi:glutamate/tyrosine decarboxylase-like PLP-dependent enzyme